ncbi:MAG: glycosyltransferase family 39 protein [Planctomycetes bacterium]|nr:glycosyltransferase family 39 protein [Planctomycetota bacterium]
MTAETAIPAAHADGTPVRFTAPSTVEGLLEPVPRDFPGRLCDGTTTPPISRRTLWLLIAIVVLAVLPRIILAVQLNAVCDDAFYYISVADSWRKSEHIIALQYLNINVYPLILWGLHQLGLDWVVAGKLWGITVSGLTVLALFGLIRRLYDERIALASCFLFAVHPELIEASVEPIRGPTFWFLFVLSLYVIQRAVETGRWFWYVVCGVCMTLAIHTRAEGWVLLVPFLLWPILLRRREHSRWRVAFGMTSSLAVIPGFLLLVNLTLLKDHDEWEWGRLTHFRNFYEWIRSDVSPENIHVSKLKPRPWSVALSRPSAARPPRAAADPPKPAVASKSKAPLKGPVPSKSPVPSAAAAQPVSTPVPIPAATRSPFEDGRWITYLKQIGRKFEPVNLLLMLMGFYGCWRVMFRRDKIVMLLVFAVLMLAIWVRLSQIGDMNGRYFFCAYLVALPFGGIGLLMGLQRLERFARRLKPTKRLQPGTVCVLALAALTLFFFTDALTASHRERRAQAKLGEWLNRELGPFQSVMVDRAATRVGYFAQGTMPTVSYYFSSSGDGVESRTPDLLIITRELSRPEERVFIFAQVNRMNLQPVTVDVIPGTSKAFLIYARRQPRSRTVPPRVAAARRTVD